MNSVNLGLNCVSLGLLAQSNLLEQTTICQILSHRRCKQCEIVIDCLHLLKVTNGHGVLQEHLL